MPSYNIKCKSCDFLNTISCSISEYYNKIKEPCPKCNQNTLYQYMGENNISIVYGTEGGWMTKKGKLGSQVELDKSLKENDMLREEPRRNDKWKRHNDKVNEQASKLGLVD